MAINKKIAGIVFLVSSCATFNSVAEDVIEQPSLNSNEASTTVVVNEPQENVKLAGVYGANQKQGHSAQNIVMQLSEDILSDMKRNKNVIEASPNYFNDLLERTIVKHIDFNASARLILGKYGKKATKAQKEEFANILHSKIVKIYSKALAAFTDQTVSFLPLKKEKNPRKVQVRSKIEQSTGAAISLDYRLYKNKDDQWKIYDFKVEDVSLVISLKNQYQAEIRKKGGLEGFLKDYRKTQEKTIAYKANTP